MTYYRLDVSYRIDYETNRREIDALIEQTVGVSIGGSGAGCGYRDLEFYFDRREDLDAAKKRLHARDRLIGFNRADVRWADIEFENEDEP